MPDARTVNVTDKSARTQERRRQSRVLISTPVRIRSLGATDLSSEESTTTVNLSPTGILIETENPAYHRNMKVAVILPCSESAGASQSEQAGIVVRVSELRHGRRSVAIALESGVKDEISKSAGAKLGREPHKSEAVNHPVPQIPESASPLILVLAQESAARSAIKTHLSGEGYEVITVSKAVEARSVLDECTPALVIAEIEGEGMPGYDLCGHCKETPRLKAVPILLMTSSAYPSDYAKAHSLGAMVCMAKPYKRERLAHVVRLLAPPPNANKETMPPGAPTHPAAWERIDRRLAPP